MVAASTTYRVWQLAVGSWQREGSGAVAADRLELGLGHRRLAALDARDAVCLVLVERLLLEERRNQRVEARAVLAQQGADLVLAAVDDAAHLLVHHALRLRGDLGGARQQRAL